MAWRYLAVVRDMCVRPHKWIYSRIYMYAPIYNTHNSVVRWWWKPHSVYTCAIIVCLCRALSLAIQLVRCCLYVIHYTATAAVFFFLQRVRPHKIHNIMWVWSMLGFSNWISVGCHVRMSFGATVLMMMMIEGSRNCIVVNVAACWLCRSFLSIRNAEELIASSTKSTALLGNNFHQMHFLVCSNNKFIS